MPGRAGQGGQADRARRRAVVTVRRARLPQSPVERRASVVLRWSRVAAFLVVILLYALQPELTGLELALLLVAAGYTGARLVAARRDAAAALIDVAIAAGLVAVTGGPASPYTVFALVAVVGAGLLNGIVAGLVAGATVTAAALLPSALGEVRLLSEFEYVAAWSALAPLTGVTGGLLGRLLGSSARHATAVLVEANRVLGSLYRIAQDMPGGLDLRAVASAAVEELREAVRCPAAVVLVAHGGRLHAADRFGIGHQEVQMPLEAVPEALRVGGSTLLTRAELPGELERVCAGYEAWLLRPLHLEERFLGMVLVALAPDQAERRTAERLDALADDTSIALDNALLFGRVQELSINSERRRLASDLHDGLAQILAHVRLELELLARSDDHAPETVRTEIERLSSVVGRALSDMRGMIHGLRSVTAGNGLVAALDAHVRDLRGLVSTDVRFDARGEILLADEAQDDLYRVAQEAISNALRHGRPRRVQVSLVASDETVRLAVEDDGVGMDHQRPVEGGVGLHTMRERAERVGGTLTIGDAPHGGTIVTLTCPVGEPPRLPARSGASTATFESRPRKPA